MRVTPITTMQRSSSEDSDERKRQRLLALLRELSMTSPNILRLNRNLASNGKANLALCKEVLKELEHKSDRRSRRVRQILINLLGLSAGEY